MEENRMTDDEREKKLLDYLRRDDTYCVFVEDDEGDTWMAFVTKYPAQTNELLLAANELRQAALRHGSDLEPAQVLHMMAEKLNSLPVGGEVTPFFTGGGTTTTIN